MGVLPLSSFLAISPLLPALSSSKPPPRIRNPTSPPILSLHSIPPSTTPFIAFPIPPNNPPGASWQPPKYVYPDPIPEFATAETQKFRGELLRTLLKNKETFGDDIDSVVQVCTEIFSDFLHKEYGGPGTLLVEPFTDILLALKERKLPGAPVAARAALLWAQNYVDRDWETWTASQPSK